MTQELPEVVEGPSLPPRPNPGPEPWPERTLSSWWLLLPILPVMALAAWRFSRRPVRSATLPLAIQPADPEGLSNAEHLTRLADQVRDRLILRFGAGVIAMSTEEIDDLLAAEPTLPRTDVVELFRAADLVKFAQIEVTDAHFAEVESRATAALEAFAEGARSTINGR